METGSQLSSSRDDGRKEGDSMEVFVVTEWFRIFTVVMVTQNHMNDNNVIELCTYIDQCQNTSFDIVL